MTLRSLFLFLTLIGVVGALGYKYQRDGFILEPPRKHLAAVPSPTIAAPPAEVNAVLDPAIDEARRAAGAAYQGGNIEDALAVLGAARSRFPDDDDIRNDFITICHNAAVSAMNDRRYALALRRLDRGEVAAQGHADHLTRLAKVRAEVHLRRAKEEQDDAKKRTHLEAALVAAPERGDALSRLATVCERENDLGCALDALTRLKKSHDGKHVSGLDAAITRLEKARAVEGDFSATENNQFVVRFEGFAHERLAYNVLDGLSHAYYRINDKLGRRPERRITVVLYTGAQYQAALGAPDWSTGFYDGKIRVREGDAQRQSGALTALLAHEYTHALLRETVAARLPGWFHEGLARHMEPGHDARGAIALSQQAAAAGHLLPLSRLVPPLSQIANADAARLAYAMSTSLLARLVDQQGYTGVQALLDATSEQSGADAFDAAFAATYFVTPEAFFTSWSASL